MDVVVLSMLKKYIQETLVGMGALKGAACQIKDIVNADGTHTVTFKWEDNDGVSHESTAIVKDGKDGTNGTNGTDGTDGVDGFSPTIVVKTSTDDTYILTITTAADSFDTPNLKGANTYALINLTDVDFTDLGDEQIIYYNSTDQKFENVDAGAVSETAYSAIAALLS